MSNETTIRTLFPKRWPPQHPGRIQLYSFGTPNGRKVSIALEEMELPYEAHRIDILVGDQLDEDYVRINPNSKIPTIVDPSGPSGEPIAIMESGAILLYLAEKTGKLLPAEPALRWEAIQWLFFQMASVGPYFGQFGHFFKFARDKTSDEYALERYANETKRLLGVLDRRLEGREFLVGGALTVADVATVPWIKGLEFYGSEERLELARFTNVLAWVERCWSRPAFQRGIHVEGL